MAEHRELTPSEAADRLAIRELFDAYAHCADGLTPALWIGAALVALGALAAFLIPSPSEAAEVVELAPALEEAA